MAHLSDLHIPRWFRLTAASAVCLVGYCDASEKAYAAAAYVVVTPSDAPRCSSLIAAKTKVAPLKTVSLPCLELCGALLLAQLLNRTLSDLDVSPTSLTCYTYSQIYQRGCVSHRVTGRPSSPIVQVRYTRFCHRHVGCTCAMLQQLIDDQIWCYVSAWLLDDSIAPPSDRDFITTLEQKKALTVLNIVTEPDDIQTLIQRFSSLPCLFRTLSYAFRWHNIIRPAQLMVAGQLIAEELEHTRERIICELQRRAFPAEITELHRNQPLPKSSKLRLLQPFSCDNNLLCVGG